MKHLVDLCECCSQRRIFLNPLKHGRWPVRVGDGLPVYREGKWCSMCEVDFKKQPGMRHARSLQNDFV